MKRNLLMLQSESRNKMTYSHALKESLREAINKMLESYGYVISIRHAKKFNRMSKSQLNNMYNLIRYQTNTVHIENDLYLIFGIVLIEE